MVTVVIESSVKVESKFVRSTAELELAMAEIWSEVVSGNVELGLVTADVRTDVGVLLIIVEIGSVPMVDVCSEAFLATDDASKLVVTAEFESGLVASAVVGAEFVAMEGEGVGRSSAKSFRSSIDDSSKMK